MLARSIASRASFAKSLILTCSSPCASRRALTIIRRYLLTETPGIATGYWNAMKRPARARSSGSDSVTSSPLKVIAPSVTSSAGWPMIALASVDLPEPFGPIRAWILPFSTSRSRPRRISLPSALTCRFLISRSAIGLRSNRSSWGATRSGGAAYGLSCARGAAGELDQLGEGRTGQRPSHAALDPCPEQLRGAGTIAIRLVRAEDLPLRRLVEALHRGDLPLQRLHDLVHRDLLRGPREAVAAVRAARGGDQAGVAQLRDQVLEVGERQALGLRDCAQGDRPVAWLAAELD